MNFVFDIGNVLISYKPLPYLEGLFPEKSVAEKVYKTIFRSPEWEYLDQGVLTYKQASEIFCAREPDYEAAICLAIENVYDIFVPIAETVELLPVIKDAGHNLYYLSNIHVEIRDYFLNKHQFFKLFNGGVFSCDVHLMKPSPEIFRCFLDTCHLAPEDCVFFDDIEENVAAARNEGINGVLFTGAQCVKRVLLNTTC